jgi:Abnormal spindle-like microcephaly-assoc'd, ASPM-SPD-2-Hydin
MKAGLVALSMALMVICSTISVGQTVEYDWSARSLGSYPTNITQTRSATVTLHNVNDVLFSYTVKSECTQNQSDPFGSIVGLLGTGSQSKTKEGAPTACDKAIADGQTAISTARSKINELLNSPTTGSGCSTTSPCDIGLSATQSFWDQNIDNLVARANLAVLAAQTQCSADAVRSLVSDGAVLSSYQTKVKSSKHDYSVQVTLIPDSSCQLTIVQRYGQTQTQNGSETATFSPGQPRMTLSAGPLFSQIQDRSYSVVTVPGSGTSTQSILQFNGVSKYTTYLTALLNFHLPVSNNWVNSERYGVALSTGPVLHLGGQSSASSFGWFGGLSYHINHLVFLSAGLHVGQFAGNPSGFTAANQVVPSNFASPTAQNRTTVRLAFAVTLKAKDFSSLSSGTSGSGTGSPAPAAPAQTPAATAGPTVSLSESTLDFGTQAVNTPSGAQPITLKNSGNGGLTISGITVTGANPGDFKQTNSCGQGLAAGGSCTLNVTFSPTGAGSKSGAISVADNATGSPHSVTLTGIAQ